MAKLSAITKNNFAMFLMNLSFPSSSFDYFFLKAVFIIKNLNKIIWILL